MGGVIRQAMQLRKRNRPGSRGAADRLHGGIECDESLSEVTGVCGDTMSAGPQDGVLPVDALERRASRARATPIAGPRDFAEILTTRSLQNVATQAGHVPDLAAGSQHQCLRDQRIVTPDERMILCLGHTYERTQPKSMRVPVYRAEAFPQVIDIHDDVRPGHAQGHVVRHVGATGNELRRGASGIAHFGSGRARGFEATLEGSLTPIVERLQARSHSSRITPAACSIAATMFG